MMAFRFMNAFKNNGENLLSHNVTTTVLYELRDFIIIKLPTLACSTLESRYEAH